MLFCWLASVVVVCNAAGVRAAWPPGVWTVGMPAAGHVSGRTADTARRAVRLRPVRATPCLTLTKEDSVF